MNNVVCNEMSYEKQFHQISYFRIYVSEFDDMDQKTIYDFSINLFWLITILYSS